MTKQLTKMKHLMLLMFVVIFGTNGFAQTTLNTTSGPLPAFANNNGSGTVTFNFQNTNAFPILINSIEGVTGGAGASTAQLWIKTAGPVNGTPGAISVANGWTLAATGTFTGVANTTTTVTQVFLSGLSVNIPAGANYGMAVTCFLTASPTSGNQRYYTMTGTNLPTTTVSGGGCNLLLGTNISYGGGAPPTAPANSPRGWMGKITFVPAGPCTAPPTTGTVASTVSSPCPNTNFTLSLTGGTGGIGQTYQWEISTNNSTWNPISGATSASLTTSQTSSNYYRCVVTCSSQSSTSGSLLVTTVGTPLAGTYTINSGLATGGTNFASFTAFANVINCAGVSAPVTVNVVAGSGPYTEQIILTQIPGASALNTITINGNGEKITFNSANSAAPSTIEFNGTDYVTVNNLIFEGQGTLYAFPCHLWNDANNNNFNNCTFTAPANGTSTTQVPFSISGSQTSATTTGASGSNNIVNGCTMNSGYYNTCFVGNSAAVNTGNQLINCNIRDQYFYGSYNLYQNGMIIRGNTIERPTRTTLSTFYGIYMSTGCVGMLVEKNKIRSPFGSTTNNTGAAYAIYVVTDGTLGNENRIFNNLIYNMKNNGTVAGLYLTGADYVKAYHNTISLDDNATAGATTTYGIYNTGTVGGIDIKNNIVSINRGGTGIKYGLYYSGTFPVSNNNVVYVIGSGTLNPGYYLTTGYTTFAAYQTASSKDAASVEANPQYNNVSVDDYTPTSSSVNNMGTPVGVTTDINGLTRSSTNPDPGCIEFNLSSVDMSILSMSAPNMSGCYSANEPVTVVIKNSGNDPLDFSLNPSTITAIFNGPSSFVVSENLTSGTLAVAGTMTVILNPPIDLTVDGIYAVTANISTLGDGNTANDNLVPFNITVGVIPGTITSSLASPLCYSAPATFTLSGQYGGAKQWQISTVSATGPWTNVGTGGNSYVASGMNQNYWIQCESSCNTNFVASNVMAMVVNNPAILSTTPGTRCGTGTVDLFATADPGNDVKWYTAPSGGTPLYTGSPFTTPAIASTTTYYAGAVVAGGGVPSQLLTTTAAGNGANGVLFDMNVLNPIIIDSFSDYVPVGTTCTIWYRAGTGVGGNQSSNVGWTQIGGQVTVNALTGVLGVIPINVGLTLQPGIHSFAICTSTTNSYTNGTAVGNIFVQDANVQIKEGYGGTTNATTIAFVNSPRVWNGRLYYRTAGCEGARTPVVATVNAAPSISVAATSISLCPGESTDVSVSSTNDPNYDYSWTSTPSGFSAIGAGPHTVVPTTVTTYSVTATDNTSGPYAGCVAYGSVQVFSAPSLSGGTITALGQSDFCVTGGSATLSNTTVTGGPIQWQTSSSASGPWTNVGTGATTYATGNVTVTTYYRVQTFCGGSSVAYSPVFAVNVYDPQILSTTPGSRCGTGTVSLEATNNVGQVKWYTTATGGSAIGTGSPFNTPSISSTTTYYASAVTGGGVATGGMAAPIPTTANGLGVINYGIVFDAISAFTLQNVTIYPSAAGTVTINLYNSAGTSINSATFTVVGGAVAQTVTLNFNILPGTNYKLAPSVMAGGGGLLFQSSGAPGGNWGYPMVVPGVLSITTSTLTAAPANTANNGLYYYFYNWVVTAGCESTRVPVVATVNAAPTMTVGANQTICAGQAATLSATSSNANYTYTWTPGNVIGGTPSVSPSATTVYTVNAVDNTPGANFGCAQVGNVTVTVNPAPVISGSSATPNTINPGCNTPVTLAATTSAPVTVLVGTASSPLTTSATAVTPYSAFYESGRIQYLILASELTGLGFSAGTMSSIGFDVTATSAFNQSGYTIKMGHTAATALSGYATIIGSLQTVYGPVTMTPPPLGVNTYNFGSPFSWDGTSNVIVEICHDNDNAANTCGICYGTAGTVRYTATTPNTVYGTYMDNGTLCGTGIGLSTVNTNTRPNIYLNGIGGQVTTKVWNPGNLPSPATVSPGVTSTYTVTCTNPVTGCTATTSQTVTVNPAATIGGLAASYSSAASAVIMTGTPSGGVFSGPGVTGNSFNPAVAGVGTHTITYLPTGYCVPASATVIVLPNNATLNLKCYIEGFYLGSGMMQPVLNNQGQSNPTTDCDTVIVELHDATTPYATAYSFTGVLQTNGTLSCTYPGAAQGNTYYVVVNHRNAMQTWSANPVTLGSITNYDFSTAIIKAYGDNQVQVETGVFAFYSGDMNQDFSIDAFDYLMMDPDIYNGAGGWLATDLNGDGSVDAFDYLIYDPNGYNGITIQSP